ncbi:Lrp/AsnC family transcriptional regulator [Candidatus Woesearchaeota archaeon]|nr:Lrp/AsnC family transcriptional regulator [Candidatus Woesearchaeota archaeon]
MLSEKDTEIIRHLRGNSRIKIVGLSKKLNLPVTTLYSKLRRYEQKLIKKHTSLVDFTQLGYFKSVYLVLKSNGSKKQELKDFLAQHSSVNSLFRINYGYDYLVECIFRDEKEVTDFLGKLQEDFSSEVQMLNVIEELKREEFMAHRKEANENGSC